MTITLGFDAQTPEQISIYCLPTRTIAADTRVTVEYKQVAASTWKTGHPLLRITPAYSVSTGPVPLVDSWAGVIFDLTPGTTYDVRLTVIEPGQPNVVITGTRSTRALPAAAGATTKTATTSDDLQAKFDSLLPGDVLVLADGVYNWSAQPYPLRMQVAGTEANPIYIRGTSITGTVIKRITGFVLQILAASHVIFEDLTLEGSSADSGTDAQSVGVSFWNGAPGQTNVTFRRILFKGVDQGIVAFAGINGTLVYECNLQGNNPWSKSYEINPASETFNYTWNDDGISLPGLGNAAWNNTLNGFGDAFSVKQEVLSAAVYFYRNRVKMTGDDACEGDYSTRNMAFYDNFVTNAGTLFSSDPIYGGPTFVHRNIAINVWRGPFKLNTTGGGLLMYSNTILKTKTPGEPAGWYLSGNGGGTNLRQWAYVNNLLVYRDSGVTPTLWLEQVGNTPIDFTNNAWFPDNTSAATIKWNVGGNFGTLAEAAAGIALTAPLFGTATRRHTGDVVSASDPFATDIAIASTYQTEFAGTPSVALSTGTTLSNAGVVIPGITDGFSGAAPDIGAAISGRAAITYGASWTTTPPQPSSGPILSAPTKSTPTINTAVVGFTTTGADGVARAVLTTSAAQPSVAQVKAGLDAGGSSVGVVAPAPLNVAVAGPASFAPATVTQGLTYYGWIVHTDATGADSAVLPVGVLYPGTYRSVLDLAVAGWSVTGAATHAAAINENAPGSAAEYITSPPLGGSPSSHTTALDKPLPAGAYTEQITASVSGGAGYLRVELLNDADAVQGTSPDQLITTTPTTYALSIVTSGIATRMRIKVWA